MMLNAANLNLFFASTAFMIILASGYFILEKNLRSESEIEKVFREGNVKIAIIYEDNFARKLEKNGSAREVLRVGDVETPNAGRSQDQSELAPRPAVESAAPAVAVVTPSQVPAATTPWPTRLMPQSSTMPGTSPSTRPLKPAFWISFGDSLGLLRS